MNTFDRAGFLAFIQSISGLLPKSVVWAKDAQPFVSPTDGAIVKCTVKRLRSRMEDETRYTYVPSTGAFTESIYGVREIVVTIRVEQFNFQTEAVEILDKISTTMGLRSSDIALRAIGLSIQDTYDSIAATYTADNREVNMAQADFTFNVVASVEFTQIDQGWIDTINGDNVIPGTFPATLQVDMEPVINTVFSLNCLLAVL